MKNVSLKTITAIRNAVICGIISTFLTVPSALGQGQGPDRDKFKDKHKLKKKEPKLPKEDLGGSRKENAKFNFRASKLKGVRSGRIAVGATLSYPTSLQFGPDGRLYVAQQDGKIKALTISRNAASDYSINAEEVITIINQIPNHNDNGALAPGVTTRQVTSLLVAGTAQAPILYVGSSDSRIGGPGGDLNLDTNSGIISKLTKTATGWDKIDLVRGLPRSEENHANNGMQIDGNKLYVVIGGNTNAGAPSTNFAFTPEYALSTAVLSIDLAAIEAMPTQGTGVNKYKYDLPTLDDPSRPGNPDANDPFGGNDGLNQAKIVAGGPVQIFATGFRNAYDLVITKTPGMPKRMYVVDNGGNQGWGGYPANEGGGSATNNYVKGEPGSTGPGPNDPITNNLDNLHYVGDLSTYVPGSFYGGHPNPIRANPAGAGLYTHINGVGVWRTSTTGSDPLPADWPPVPVNMAKPIEGDFQNPGETDNALLTFYASTNGLVEYTASGFGPSLKGQLLAASMDGNIQKISLNANGTDVTNTRGNKRINQDLPFASNFGASPLDITAQGDNDIFPGTVWVACYSENSVFVFEPETSSGECAATYNPSADNDGDGYSNTDEIDNASNPCSAASRPADADADSISDFNDPDDDNDGLADDTDYFPLDRDNGLTTTLPIEYDFFNNYPGTGLFGLGFTGLMLPKRSGFNYLDLFDEQNLIAGGAVGALSVVATNEGDPYQGINNQENAFQFGVKVDQQTGPFTVQSRLLGPFFSNQTPGYFQSQGVYIGTGDQDNYLKIVLGADGGQGGLEVLHEQNGVVVKSTFYPMPGGAQASTVDLYLSINPATGSVQPKYAKDGGPITNLGSPFSVDGELLTVLRGARALAVGLISTSIGSTPFTATWDMLSVKADAASTASNTTRINSGGNAFLASSGRQFAADAQFTGGNVFTIAGTPDITNTSDDGLYRSERWGDFSYNVPVSNGTYSVVLHFAEIYHNYAGARKFNVDIEGARRLADYDIVAKAGASQRATQEAFAVSVTDGMLNIVFSKGSADNAKVSGIEIVPLAVESLKLVNADNGQEIGTLVNNDIVNLATLPTSRLSVRANTSPANVGSVVFVLSGQQSHTKLEHVPPYALFGDTDGKYQPWTPTPGSYTLKATPYVSTDGTGVAGSPLTIAFTVINKSGGRAGSSAEEGFSDGWRLYPNPTNGVINIEFDNSQLLPLKVDVVNVLGQSVKQFSKEDLSPVNVDLKDFAPGVYFLTVRSASGSVTRKLIKH